MAVFRGFIAIEIPAAPSIIDFENAIAKTSADVKLVEPENIHLTLKFLGDTNEEQIDAIGRVIEESVAGIKPFMLTLKGTGVFPNERYIKVVWVGIVNGDNLSRIAQAIDQKLEPLGFTKERRGYSAHLTIGRVRTAKNKDQLLTVIQKYQEKEFLQKEIQAVALKKSDLTPQGPIYTTLREIPL
ncbi:MAG TPA: RNA 2',3'-cyclic phosphodiesterase [Candidatus Thermoplasmatota archaeon]|nr:RNA 2',3'-cyclic phosphodiesterase [Candidatus Thermoplasmatota archaeon]